ncbi:MAG: DNA helicase PcrA [Eubacteriales bacterium]|nr:DNA helicase PcrA [Eubacteriales bacterium]
MVTYDTLNNMQREAVFHTEGPLLILAGAGSGKTRVLTYRIARLIEEENVNPWNILAITFTNKAAGEMRERVDRLVEKGAASVWVSTFHSLCVRILRRHIDRLGYGNSFTIYDADDQKSLMKDICKRLDYDTKIYRERSILAAISSAKDELIGPDEFEKQSLGDYHRQKIAAAYREYQEQMRRNNALDFDDLIVKTVELFRTCPDVLENYQERFRYIMVDEYQDTNTAQFTLISLLALKYRNLCVVGDDDQSIYKFRGANIGNILNFEKIFEDARVIKLEQNYRSTENILNVANEVIKNNYGRKAKTLWTENGTGETVRLKRLANAFEEADFVSADIAKKVRKHEADYGDCAVLYRTNAQSRLFEEKFLLANIPYKIVGGVNFYARKEIKDLLAYLKTIDNARDDLAVRRIINIPKRGIGAATLAKVQTYAMDQEISFYEALKRAEDIPGIGRSAGKLQNFVTFIQTLRSHAEFLGVQELLKTLIESTGYVAGLEAEDTEEARGRIENIDELISKAASYEENASEPDLSGFLEEVALVADIDSLEEDENRVVLMTLHSAKGLEFPDVYLTGMEEGLFPSYMSIAEEENDEIEEERRLCYVGITRAMKHLTLSYAVQRMVRGETRYSTMSRFLREIPQKLVDDGKGETKTAGADGLPWNSPARTTAARTGGNPYVQAKKAFQSKVFDLNDLKVTRADHLEYDVGDRVKHVKFGIGTVQAIAEGGRDYEVTVDFEKYGVKKMFAAFAKLVKL